MFKHEMTWSHGVKWFLVTGLSAVCDSDIS